MWTAFSGSLGTAFDHLVSQFNASQSQYRVTAVYKGSYSQVLSDTIAAFKAHAAPDISQIFDAGTATIMDSAGSYVPVYKLMSEYKIPFSTGSFIGGAASYYETSGDQLDSMPFNSSTPVLYYNKAELQAAGISTPPTTWSELESDASVLAAHGQKCALSSSGAYVMWTDMEEFSTWNGYPYANHQNGYTGIKGMQLKINSAPIVDHLALLGRLASKGEYIWNGVSTSTVPLFTNGTCAMYEQSSASLNTIEAAAKFPFGVAELPVVAGDKAAPQNTVVGGASLWVMSGAPAVHYRGDAEFLHFLMSAQSQAYWASNTGYVPVTPAGSSLLSSQGFYSSHPNDLVAVKELTNKAPTADSRGIRLGYLPEVRQVEASAIAAVLSGKQSAAAAVSSAETQGNTILAQFASQYGG
ncbi:extracellular solute-binding protein [Acidiferrimicrobium sp. IK]|uniref:extracellular solute-binding protein n=1 Tax=Acidiferrimicrobium sp. IK TaxID=2871700 RepID=UPI0021CB949F|nr:extracellular solute-binding protein [Acidiferrimicrobium sp. IK]MCU4185371.1 extracellular solute-binding protein [Acidiferrimicrobium sp. IK]